MNERNIKTAVQMGNNGKMLKGAMTKLPVFDMIATGLTTRQAFRLMIPELIFKAKQFLKAGALELPVGTYTAKDIHRLLNKTYKNYYEEDKAQTFLFNRSCPIDVNSTQWVVQDSGIYSFPLFNVFYVLWKCEIQAGWSGSKAHKFIVEDKRECVSESIITFSEEKHAKKLSSMVRQNNFPLDKPCQLSLSDGCIRCTYSASREKDIKGHILKSRIDPYDGFLLSPLEFSMPNDFSDLCVRFDGQQLSHLYGECKLRIFMNEKGDGTNRNPHNIRVTIENPDGWIVASDIIEYKIKYLDIEDLNEKQHESAQNEAYSSLISTVDHLHNNDLHNHAGVIDTKLPEDEDNTIKNTLNLRSTNNRNEKTVYPHQKVHQFLPDRRLPIPSVLMSGEESNPYTSTLHASQLIHPLSIEISNQIRKLYGECKSRVYINSHNIFLLIETVDGWIIGNEFLKYKICTPVSVSHPTTPVEEWIKPASPTNHVPATLPPIDPGLSSSASIHKTEFDLTASQESKKYCIPTTHTPTREDIEHSVKNLLISRKMNE